MFLNDTQLLQRLLWKKWKIILIIVAILFVLLQVKYASILGISQKDLSNIQFRQHAALKKVLSKWEGPQHSKVVKDKDGNDISLRGTRIQDLMKYLPNSKGNFICFVSKREIDFHKINDDYCDCPEDGSDEPGTSACKKGIFYCEESNRKTKGNWKGLLEFVIFNKCVITLVKVPSIYVNDGICDCCDGSDEWAEVTIINTQSVYAGNSIKYQITNCKNICKN